MNIEDWVNKNGGLNAIPDLATKKEGGREEGRGGEGEGKEAGREGGREGGREREMELNFEDWVNENGGLDTIPNLQKREGGRREEVSNSIHCLLHFITSSSYTTLGLFVTALHFLALFFDVVLQSQISL